MSNKLTTNLFCARTDLKNEASVERLFTDRLLKHLGYADEQVLPKTSIDELPIGKGSKKLHYKPDYMLLVGKTPRWIIDAKAPSENLDNWVEQCASYCLAINSRLKAGQNRVLYFLLTNGLESRVYAWDKAEPLLVLQFEDCLKGNSKLKQLEALLSADAVKAWKESKRDQSGERMMKFVHPTPNVINGVFAECNNYIYKHDNISPAAAFHEFVKVVFLKIKADRELHGKYSDEMREGLPVPVKDVVFSVAWLESLKDQHPNPLDIQFQKLLEDLEREVISGTKKRIFDKGERIKLRPDTAKEVVRRLQNYDLFGIDEDLNGRLFEAFLSATMRGRELGQYFTPRSAVKLMTRLADPQVHGDKTDRIIDPCCGTGGFLIEAMAVLERAVSENDTLSNAEKNKLRKFIRERALFGIDVGQEPPIARIARINMYLHGDGGSRIYIAEALDKGVGPQSHMSPELAAEVSELKRKLSEKEGLFDIIITNPPFSKEYDPAVASERSILREYDLAQGAAAKKKLKSNALFLERYRDLARPGGKVLAIVDDSLLAGDSFAHVRNFIRANFIVRAVISLPGDAFQRSGARVKTSIVYLTRRQSADEEQPAVFMWYCTAIGVDDSARQRVLPEDAVRREEATKEIFRVVEAFRKAQAGKDKAHLVPASRIGDRLDVKSCVVRLSRKAKDWEAKGLEVASLSQWVLPRVELWSGEPSETVNMLSVTYDGHAVAEEKERDTVKGKDLYVARAGDLVASHINAVHGAICVLPAELDGSVVSPEYTVLTPKEGMSAHALWAILRSPEVRADMLASTSGHGRHRIDSSVLLQLRVPRPTAELSKSTVEAFKRARELEEEAAKLRAQAQSKLEREMALTSEEANNIILAFKPPR
ncbi:N-6 DNA methylase [Archangium violaceum]|uniref:N-6 DNA methylase n=1 Tax=Archangium violaceum TaxID=83451 RepID=UPI000B1E2B69|nr:N-6 DNA methylase [Archangium violaceum]